MRPWESLAGVPCPIPLGAGFWGLYVNISPAGCSRCLVGALFCGHRVGGGWLTWRLACAVALPIEVKGCDITEME